MYATSGTLSRLRPTVNFASLDEAPARMVWGPRVIPDWQLFYVISGEAQLQLGSDTHRLVSGDYACYGPRSPHRLTAVQPIRFFSLHFHFDHESPAPVHPAYSIVLCPESDLAQEPIAYTLEIEERTTLQLPHRFAAPGLESIHERLVAEYQRELPGQGWLLRALLMELWTGILRHLLVERPVSPDRTKIEPALKAMEEHPEVNWTVARLAGLSGYHAVYFASLFHRVTGTNPKQYLIAERIRKAKYYLLNNEKLEVIAERLGYSSLHYFSRNFKELTGLTPTQFKLRNH